MITDQINSQVPSASRGRMQLVKPQQTMNSGSTVTSSAPTSSMQSKPLPENVEQGSVLPRMAVTKQANTKSEQLDAESQKYLDSLKNRQSAFKALQSLDDETRKEVMGYFGSSDQGMAGATSSSPDGLSAKEQAKLIVDNLAGKSGGVGLLTKLNNLRNDRKQQISNYYDNYYGRNNTPAETDNFNLADEIKKYNAEEYAPMKGVYK